MALEYNCPLELQIGKSVTLDGGVHVEIVLDDVVVPDKNILPYKSLVIEPGFSCPPPPKYVHQLRVKPLNSAINKSEFPPA